MDAVLTLQVPDLAGNRGFVIAATTDRAMLLTFRRFILQRYRERLENTADATVRELRSYDLQRVHRALDAFVPEDTA